MTAVRICNLALSHLRSGSTISSLTETGSELARICNLFYDQARQIALRDFAWPFARKSANLTLIDDVNDGTREWRFQYFYPNDALRLIKISSTVRDDTRRSRVRYQVETGTTSRAIFTDMEEARAYYICDLENTDFFPPDFFMALSYLIASYIAPIVTDGDTEGLGNNARVNYNNAIMMAKANSLNEEQHEEIDQGEYIQFRE